MRILVTGGAGFIGSHTVQTLLAEGHTVSVLDNLSSGKRENLSAVGNVELLQGDIVDSAVCEHAVKDTDAVIHLAAQISVVRSIEAPGETHRTNVDGTLNLLEACRKQGVKRFVFASSCAVYGDATNLPIDEKTETSPLSPYAVSKLMGEYYCNLYRKLHGVQTAVFRFFNIFGPRQDDASPYASAIAIFSRRLLSGQPVTIFGDGEQTRDFLFVKDVAKALSLAAQKTETFAAPAFNLASGKQTSVREMYSLLSRATAREVPLNFSAPRSGEIKHSLGSSKKFAAVAEINGETFKPTSLEAALKKTVEWYASRH